MYDLRLLGPGGSKTEDIPANSARFYQVMPLMISLVLATVVAMVTPAVAIVVEAWLLGLVDAEFLAVVAVVAVIAMVALATVAMVVSGVVWR